MRRKLRRRSGGRPKKGAPALKAQEQGEIELAHQAELAYRRLVSDWQSVQGAGATRDTHLQGRLSGKQRGRAQSQTPRFSSSSPEPSSKT
jgi:hypothetical protein